MDTGTARPLTCAQEDCAASDAMYDELYDELYGGLSAIQPIVDTVTQGELQACSPFLGFTSPRA